ncbi:MAG: MFS transporter [Planctomycetes bacterium]|nr:MFS transporter [Planctomycetota bacterium]
MSDPDLPQFRRTYRAIYAACLATAIGMTAFVPFLKFNLEALGVRRDDGSLELWTGLVTGAAPLTAAFSGALWGAIGDRIGRRLMMLRALLGIVVFVGLCSFATQPWQLLVLRLLQGLFSGYVAPALTLVSVSAPEGKQSSAVAGIQGSMALGFCFGPLLGEVVRRTGAPESIFWFTSGLAALSLLAVLAFVPRDRPHEERRAAGSEPPPTALGELKRWFATAHVPQLLGAVFAVRFAFAASNAMVAIFVAHELRGLDPAWEGFVVAAAFTGPHAIGVVTVKRWSAVGDRLGPRRSLAICALGSGAFLAPQAWSSDAVVFLVLVTLSGFFYAGVMPLAYAEAGRLSSRSARGSSFGLLFSSLTLALALGPFFGGGLAELVGSVRPLFPVTGAICLASGALLLSRRGGAVAAPTGGVEGRERAC